jgi:hypothetical protein
VNHYPPSVTELVQLPGYVRGLHWREHAEKVCQTCNADWPCAGVKLQFLQARPFTDPFWLLPETTFWERARVAVRRATPRAMRDRP